MVLGLALGFLMMVALGMPSHSFAVSWEFNCTGFCGLPIGAYGNERSFTAAGGEVVTVRGFATPNSNGTGNFVEAYLGQYGGGLGVTSPGIAVLGGNGDGLGLLNTHTVDNNGKNDLIVFRLPTASYIPLNVFLTAFGDTDVDVWIGGNGLSFSNFTSLSYATLAAYGFTACGAGNSGGSSDRTADFSSCGLSGQYLIIGANNNAEDDAFKIASLTGDVPPNRATANSVPEPSAMILLGMGLIALRVLIAKGSKITREIPVEAR